MDESLKPTTRVAKIGWLIEECGEVAQVCGKALRFGWKPTAKGITYDNAADLRRELQDLKRAIELVEQELEGV